MHTIQTTAVVTPEHTVTLTLPADIPPGVRDIVVVLPADTPAVTASSTPAAHGAFTAGWPVFDLGPWPEGFTVSREQVYADGAR